MLNQPQVAGIGSDIRMKEWGKNAPEIRLTGSYAIKLTCPHPGIFRLLIGLEYGMSRLLCRGTLFPM